MTARVSAGESEHLAPADTEPEKASFPKRYIESWPLQPTACLWSAYQSVSALLTIYMEQMKVWEACKAQCSLSCCQRNQVGVFEGRGTPLRTCCPPVLHPTHRRTQHTRLHAFTSAHPRTAVPSHQPHIHDLHVPFNTLFYSQPLRVIP